jgi:hypothetical protein
MDYLSPHRQHCTTSANPLLADPTAERGRLPLHVDDDTMQIPRPKAVVRHPRRRARPPSTIHAAERGRHPPSPNNPHLPLLLSAPPRPRVEESQLALHFRRRHGADAPPELRGGGWTEAQEAGARRRPRRRRQDHPHSRGVRPVENTMKMSASDDADEVVRRRMVLVKK